MARLAAAGRGGLILRAWHHFRASHESAFYIHPDNPQPRLINQAVEVLRKGGVIVYPTDSGYALGCMLEEKAAMERICRIRQLDGNHNFTLMCRDLSELSTYAHVDNTAFRLIKTIRRATTPSF